MIQRTYTKHEPMAITEFVFWVIFFRDGHTYHPSPKSSPSASVEDSMGHREVAEAIPVIICREESLLVKIDDASASVDTFQVGQTGSLKAIGLS